MEDLFERWGMPRDVSDKEVVKVYRQRAQRMHPDRMHGASYAQKSFIKLQQEYQFLKVSYNRDKLKKELEEKEQNNFSKEFKKEEKETRKKKDNYRESNDHFYSSSYEDNMDKNFTFIPSSDIHIYLKVSLKDISSGLQSLLNIERAFPCYCGYNKNCVYCHGTGQRFSLYKIKVVIPRFIKDKQMLLLKNMGNVGSNNIGDAYVHIIWIKKNGWNWSHDKCELYKTINVNYKKNKRVYTRLHNGTIYSLGGQINSDTKILKLYDVYFESTVNNASDIVIYLKRPSGSMLVYNYIYQKYLSILYKLSR